MSVSQIDTIEGVLISVSEELRAKTSLAEIAKIQSAALRHINRLCQPELGLKIKCSNCKKSLDKKSALHYSSPIESTEEYDVVRKYHICERCWNLFEYWLSKGEINVKS